MIIDRISNWKQYPFGPAWKLAFEFLISLPADPEEKKYIVQGDEIFASIARYKTREPEKAVLESHRKFVDVHAVIKGREAIECFPRDGLTIDSAYDESKDAEFYKRVCPGPVRSDLYPGSFITLFPHDAHMSSLMINETSETVTKVVVKIKSELLTF